MKVEELAPSPSRITKETDKRGTEEEGEDKRTEN
jgi:hypothetical protein